MNQMEKRRREYLMRSLLSTAKKWTKAKKKIKIKIKVSARYNYFCG